MSDKKDEISKEQSKNPDKDIEKLLYFGEKEKFVLKSLKKES